MSLPSDSHCSPPPAWLARGVLGIGLASLFSDWGHETATALLPILLAGLGAPAFALGVIEGVADGLSSFAALFGVAGIYIAMAEALEKSLAAELLPAEVRGSGFGVLATANGIGDFTSSILVGLLWSSVAPVAGFLYAAVLSVAGAFLIYRAR